MCISRTWLIYGLSNQSSIAQKVQGNNTTQPKSWFHIDKCVWCLQLKLFHDHWVGKEKKSYLNVLIRTTCPNVVKKKPNDEHKHEHLHCFHTKTPTSIGNCRDSSVEVFEADHSKTTGIQKLGQVLYLKAKLTQDSKLVILCWGKGGTEWKKMCERNQCFIYIYLGKLHILVFEHIKIKCKKKKAIA